MAGIASSALIREVQDALTALGVGESGALIGGTWRFGTSTVMADPGSGRFRYDDATPSSVANIAISRFTRSGFDADNALAALALNDRLYVQEEKSAAAFQCWNVTSVVDNSTWFQIEVTSVALGGAIRNNGDSRVGAIFT